ncbi:putative uncharacterized protein DDB_G0287457 isoform X3 [Plutella xylostella]|uniref:putative uncharacterized protein DDB_G0287457 isoform X3 n=1 Tax=Plutella xylostella TaxID=51655 RepID=UPI0020328C50|nr:putative uncharacterized protein DDB_G0287457 isoform X3 [Plutella xylostella]
MKKRTISKLKSIFGSKKGKKQQHPNKSRTPSPSPEELASCSVRSLPRTPPPTRPAPPPSPPVPTHPVAPVAPEPPGPLTLSSCPVCGRTFVPESLFKHVKICEKMAAKKRKTFDSSRQRREGLSATNGVINNGTDLEQYLPKNFGLPDNSPFLEKSPPCTAKPTPKAKPAAVRHAITKPSAELQRCPHCTRAFGPRAFERHVEWCADKAKILPAAPAQAPARLSDAKQRLNARTQYKAPPVRGRLSSQSRDKCSMSRSTSVESSRAVSPPRERADSRHERVRASESLSSNDDVSSPHVPVIRTSRGAPAAAGAGDAGVRARQARLARDLSSSRIDDSYDPFAKAARQMKELMASDNNIPQKLQTSHKQTPKDLNRTLPNIRPAKDKHTMSYLRPDNTKLMKDTLNKNYQKTPTLQRMKSFGSTNNDYSNTFGGRCSSFRLNRNESKKSSQTKLNTTFTKSSKENISTLDKSSFNRNSSLNRSFSSYTTSSYSTPKPRDKIPKIATSYHSFQRTTIKQPVKLDKINNKSENKKDFVNLDSILTDDNSSTLTDSNYIDPRLINENDNLPINVNTILNNPDIISSMESLLTTENLPAKFESFSSNTVNNNYDREMKFSQTTLGNNRKNNILNNNTNKSTKVDDLGSPYDKMMSSIEQSIASKTSIRDDDSLCEDFDLDEFMTAFDDEVQKQRSENKRSCSSTTRVVKQAELIDSNKSSKCSSPVVKTVSNGNGMIPYNKSMSFNFSSNNIVNNDNLFPSSVKRSSSLLDSIQKKSVSKTDSGKSRHNADLLEQDIMHSLKDFDKFYENESHSVKETAVYNVQIKNGHDTAKRDARAKAEKKNKKNEDVTNGNYTPNTKSTDSAYSRLVSLNRISPSKLSVCNAKESNGMSLERIPAGSDSSRENDVRSMSSDEFLAMERSAELDEPIMKAPEPPPYKDIDSHKVSEKRSSSRASSRHSGTWQPRLSAELSTSSSDGSLHRRAATPGPRLSRFCHECGSKFPMDTAKFCIECGVKRLAV